MGFQLIVAIWCVVLAAVIILSPRDSFLHNLFRGFMTVGFSISFIYIFTAGSIAAAEVDKRRGGNDGVILFRQTFTSFVVAVVCWILDIVCCNELQTLPFGLPYPQ